MIKEEFLSHEMKTVYIYTTRLVFQNKEVSSNSGNLN